MRTSVWLLVILVLVMSYDVLRMRSVFDYTLTDAPREHEYTATNPF